MDWFKKARTVCSIKIDFVAHRPVSIGKHKQTNKKRKLHGLTMDFVFFLKQYHIR